MPLIGGLSKPHAAAALTSDTVISRPAASADSTDVCRHLSAHPGIYSRLVRPQYATGRTGDLKREADQPMDEKYPTEEG